MDSQLNVYRNFNLLIGVSVAVYYFNVFFSFFYADLYDVKY